MAWASVPPLLFAMILPEPQPDSLRDYPGALLQLGLGIGCFGVKSFGISNLRSVCNRGLVSGAVDLCYYFCVADQAALDPANRYAMTQEEVAAHLNVCRDTLWKWRKRGEGPPYRIVLGRVIYGRQALLDWLEEGDS